MLHNYYKITYVLQSTIPQREINTIDQDLLDKILWYWSSTRLDWDQNIEWSTCVIFVSKMQKMPKNGLKPFEMTNAQYNQILEFE